MHGMEHECKHAWNTVNFDYMNIQIHQPAEEYHVGFKVSPQMVATHSKRFMHTAFCSMKVAITSSARKAITSIARGTRKNLYRTRLYRFASNLHLTIAVCNTCTGHQNPSVHDFHLPQLAKSCFKCFKSTAHSAPTWSGTAPHPAAPGMHCL